VAGFGTAITCIGGRVYERVVAWMKAQHRLGFVDLITVPGPDDALVHGLVEQVTQVEASAHISVFQHGSTVVAIAGHHDCAANPVSDEEHLEQIRQCVQIIRAWHLSVLVIGLWVNEEWQVEPVS